jgi:hypothetical protein
LVAKAADGTTIMDRKWAIHGGAGIVASIIG